MPKLDSSLAIGRATYQRWLGTEPDEIAAAAEGLRRFEPEHPLARAPGDAVPPGSADQGDAREILHPERRRK